MKNFTEEVESNDYPQGCKMEGLGPRDQTGDIQEMCDVSITTKKSYVAPPRME